MSLGSAAIVAVIAGAALPVVVGLCMVFRVMVGRGSKAGACGYCQYPARGLGSLQCPECGSDLRLVGITTRHLRRPAGMVAYALLWLSLLPPVAFSVSMVFDQVFAPRVVAFDHMALLDFTSPSSSLDRVVITARARQFRWFYDWDKEYTYPGGPGEILMTAGGAELTIDLRSDEYSFVDGTGQLVAGPGLPDAKAFRRWLQAANPDQKVFPDDTVLEKAMQAVEQAAWLENIRGPVMLWTSDIRGFDLEARERGFLLRDRSMGAIGKPSLVGMWVMGIFWFIVWIAGLVMVVRRARLGKVLYSPSP